MVSPPLLCLRALILAVPANAMTAPPVGAGATSETVQVRYYNHHRRVCTVRTIVKRGYHGRRIVKHVRVCR
ncbi:hypothetical protein ACVWWK_002596 [Bradyrhizobium sp. LB9.1b]